MTAVTILIIFEVSAARAAAWMQRPPGAVQPPLLGAENNGRMPGKENNGGAPSALKDSRPLGTPGDDVKKLARGFVALCGLAIAAGSAQGGSLRVVGTAGYLSEWELSADLADAASAKSGRFSGPLHLKHVGLCAHNGPEEKTGEITVQIYGSGPFSRIETTLLFDGISCKSAGRFSREYQGSMDCSDAQGVPLAFSLK